ncbi:MAG: ABC transporter permease [Vicinamibacteria bacterium]
MIRHLFKLIWNRRRANALVITEIFVCFLVLFAVVTLGIYSVLNYRSPLGFAYANVYSIDVDFEESRGDGSASAASAPGAVAVPTPDNPYEARQRALLQIVKADPSVEDAAWASPIPFSHSNEIRSDTVRKHTIRYSLAHTTDEYKNVMGIQITRGRWFSAEDDGAAYEPMVITEALARAAFGSEDPVGQSLTEDRPAKAAGEPHPEKERRVVGVMTAFRQEGEMDINTETNASYALTRVEYPSGSMRRIGSIAARMKAGANADVEARVAKSLLAAAPDWSFKITPLEMSAAFNRQVYTAPLVIAAVIAGFLILMVALGLSGVLWQSVTTRTREIGVRRALGASAADVRWQVIGELLVMATIAMMVGVIVVLQFPFLDLLGPIPRSVFFAGLSLTIVALYALALACGLQPARLATTVQPAEALRYE